MISRKARTMANEITQPAQLRCAIVHVSPPMSAISSPTYHYIVTDESGIVVAEGASSSPEWVRNDAGGYHTKRDFDAKFPQGWSVNFDF